MPFSAQWLWAVARGFWSRLTPTVVRLRLRLSSSVEVSPLPPCGALLSVATEPGALTVVARGDSKTGFVGGFVTDQICVPVCCRYGF